MLPVLPNRGSKMEKLWNCLTKRPRTVQTPGDATHSNLVSRCLQNNSEGVTPPCPGRLDRSATQGNPEAKNSLQPHLTAEGNPTCCRAVSVWPSYRAQPVGKYANEAENFLQRVPLIQSFQLIITSRRGHENFF